MEFKFVFVSNKGKNGTFKAEVTPTRDVEVDINNILTDPSKGEITFPLKELETARDPISRSHEINLPPEVSSVTTIVTFQGAVITKKQTQLPSSGGTDHKLVLMDI